MVLSMTDPVIDIAAAVGHEDPGAFAKAFRKAVGTTPTAYRRDH